MYFTTRTPSQTRSISSARNIGRNTGMVISMIPIGSRNMPRIR